MRFVALGFVLAILFVVFGCGVEDQETAIVVGTTSRITATAPPTPIPTPAPATDAPAQPAVASVPVRVLPPPDPGQVVIHDTIRRVFGGGERAEQAIRVAGCESTGDTTEPIVIDQAPTGNPTHAGAFQLARVHTARAERLGFTWEQVRTLIEPNAKVAENLQAEQGWRPWACRWAA